jgi:HPt (histidine-containing phosphotransfer) domain-containing protein
LLREISGLFVADAAHRLEELRRAIAAGDERAARRANHTLLGAAGNFGAREVDRSLRRLGRMLRSGALGDPGAAGRLRPALVRAERRVAGLVERLARVASTAEPQRG